MGKSIKLKIKNEIVYPYPYYPVGSIYLSTISVNPTNFYGGTWEQIRDVFLLACGNIYTNGITGGSATHTLTIEEMPKHSHIEKGQVSNPSGYADMMLSREYVQ